MRGCDRWGDDLAPCVAVVGPANSGKTTLLHRLDRALQEHPARPLVCVVKGNPDGTGRYLFESPALREALKPRVKGVWRTETIETVRAWTEHARARLELVLLDFGGKHTPANREMLARCTHFIVMARVFDDPVRERDEGRQSWIDACARCGLEPVARVRSMLGAGEPEARLSDDGVIEAAFRSDAAAPDDETNAAVIARLIDALMALRRPRPQPGYIDLHLARRWTPADLPDLAGCAAEVEQAARGGHVALGGIAPAWAYAAAMHRALDVADGVALDVFDPKVLPGFVRVPAQPRAAPVEAPLARTLDVCWRAAPGGATLDVRVTAPDRFLGIGDEASLAALPLPPGTPAAGRLVTCGALPIWLHLAYSRWLRGFAPAADLGLWDASLHAAVPVHAPRGGTDVWPWEPPDGAPA